MTALACIVRGITVVRTCCLSKTTSTTSRNGIYEVGSIGRERGVLGGCQGCGAECEKDVAKLHLFCLLGVRVNLIRQKNVEEALVIENKMTRRD